MVIVECNKMNKVLVKLLTITLLMFLQGCAFPLTEKGGEVRFLDNEFAHKCKEIKKLDSVGLKVVQISNFSSWNNIKLIPRKQFNLVKNLIAKNGGNAYTVSRRIVDDDDYPVLIYAIPYYCFNN